MGEGYICTRKTINGHIFVLEERKGISLDVNITSDGRIFVFIVLEKDNLKEKRHD